MKFEAAVGRLVCPFVICFVVENQVIFEDLVPGRLYEITAWTVSGGVTSHPVLRQDRLYPEPVSDITASDISDTELKLMWRAPIGDWTSFQVRYLLDHL